MTYNISHKKIICGILIVGLILFLKLNVNAYIYDNGSGDSYQGSGGGGDYGGTATLSSCNIIEYYVIQGAGYFLTANSDVQRLLNRVELSSINGCDSFELLSLTNSAIFNMNLAKDTYYFMIKIAEVTPYNETVIAKLKSFDYDSFMYRINAAPDIFKEVADYLKRGDVTGNYKRSYKKFGEITEILKAIRANNHLEGIPSISVLWKLNQEFQKTLLGGQYAAQVFHEILVNPSNS